MKFKSFQFKIILIAALSLTGIVAFSRDSAENPLDVFRQKISAKAKEWSLNNKRPKKQEHSKGAQNTDAGVKEFYKLLQFRQKIGVFKGGVEQTTGKPIYAWVTGFPDLDVGFTDPRIEKKLYDYCEVCHLQRVREAIGSKTGYNFHNDQQFKETCSKACQNLNKPDQAIRKHNIYYKALLDMTLKEFKKSPELFQGDKFKSLRAELERHKKEPPIRQAPVATQNLFNFMAGEWLYGHCQKDSDCLVLTRNCCGCLLDKYAGSDKTLFALSKDSLGWSPEGSSLEGYLYKKRQHCRVFGVNDSTCAIKGSSIPRPLTFVHSSCRRKTKKEYDEDTRHKYLKIINDQIELCKTGDYRTSYYVSGSWCEHKNYEYRIRNYYNRKAKEEIKKCEDGKAQEERWDKWLTQNKRAICGNFKAKCNKNSGKCSVVTATGEKDKDEDKDKDKAPIITTLIYKNFKNPSHFTDGCQVKSDCMMVSGNCCQSGKSGVAFAILKQKKEEYWKTRYKECKKADLLKEQNKCVKTGKHDVNVACINSKCVTQPKTSSSSGSM